MPGTPKSAFSQHARASAVAQSAVPHGDYAAPVIGVAARRRLNAKRIAADVMRFTLELHDKVLASLSQAVGQGGQNAGSR